MKSTIESAFQRIAPYIKKTACRLSPSLSEAVGAEVYLKLENQQLSGSFKLRGVFNKLLSLSAEEARSELVAASTGNHGAAFAHAVQELGLRGRLFLPCNAAKAKLEAIEGYGLPYELVGNDCVETENHARVFAREHDCTWVSPYNDPEIVAGQGTVAVELLEQLERFDAILVPVGGGGLAGGISAYLASADTGATVYGCQPQNSCVMYESVKAGKIVEIKSLPTLSDATAGGIETGSITFDLCRRFVHEYLMVTEEQIAGAIRHVYTTEKLKVEGGATLPVAALLKDKDRFQDARVVLVISGSRIDDALLKEVLS
ncbi:MAG: pyridoxal-phosphate dependent enzyme [bacterium]|nr:pyridoxal-phosphate dependent enzyme [bacterium]